MATVMSPPEAEAKIMENISWEAYERILAEHPNSASLRFTYNDGWLELMILSVEHEEPNRILAAFIDIITAEMNIHIRRVGSNTFQREDLLKGFEPDSAFYLAANAKAVRGKKRLDLATDPPPDLIIEIDVTSPSLPRFPIFAAVGVPEVWRYKDGRVGIFALRGEGYEETPHSLALPSVTGEVLTRFLKESEELDSPEWTRRVRAWAQSAQS
ncbi:MAG: Uma2 family endonuclease [Pyrinomonadaceae bacterium MAG19_C2-C3]|nr:Uma2 family endonuclease [Pyrinomonadaceae bacterium MAG19_C2-C3]